MIPALRLRVRLECGPLHAIGPGKADLLEAIAREGSISAAGRMLGVSYRRCWLLVDEMNRCWDERLVETAIGGKTQGARLTPLGREVLDGYRALQARLAAAAEGPELAALSARLRDHPAE